MTLENYISKLLLSNDCVVVPGFGAFVARSFSAELNSATQMFLPPSRRLSFQPGLRSDDGKLIDSISRRESRNKDVIRLEISDIVSYWHKQLHRGERMRLDGLGMFYIDRQGQLQFKPQVDVNFDVNHFGLGVFRASPLVIVREDQKVIPLHERKERSRTPLWKVAAVAAGVSGLVFLGGSKSDINISDNVAGFMDLLSWTTPTESTISDVEVEATPDATTDLETEVEDVEVAIPSVEISTRPVPVKAVQKDTYYVIVGSFVEKANADDLYRELSQKGHSPEVLPFDGRFTKVAIAAFKSRNEAVSALRVYKNDVQRGAWIYRK